MGTLSIPPPSAPTGRAWSPPQVTGACRPGLEGPGGAIGCAWVVSGARNRLAHGDLQGIAGRAFEEIEGLEIPLLEGDIAE